MRKFLLLASAALAGGAAVTFLSESDARADAPANVTRAYRSGKQCWSTSSSDTTLLENGNAQLVWTAGGDLSVVVGGVQQWDTGTAGGSVCLQGDGNLYIQSEGVIIWQAGMPAAPANGEVDGYGLSVDSCGVALTAYNDDGSAYWEYFRAGSLACNRTTVYSLGGWLSGLPAPSLSWTKLSSAPGMLLSDGSAHLDWQADGNLVLYSWATGGALWASNTYQTGKELTMGPNSLSVADASGNVLWSASKQDAGAASFLSLSQCNLSDADNDTGIFLNVNPSSCPAMTPGASWSYAQDMSFGASPGDTGWTSFGGEVWVVAAATNAANVASLEASAGPRERAALQALVPQNPPSDLAEIVGSVGAVANGWGVTETALDLGIYVSNLNGGSNCLNATVMGNTIHTGSFDTFQFPTVTIELGDADAETDVLGVKLYLSMEMDATVGASLTTRASLGGYSFGVEPTVDVAATFSGGISVLGYGIGPYGTVDVLSLDVPMNFWLDPAERLWSLSGNPSYSSVSGSYGIQGGPVHEQLGSWGSKVTEDLPFFTAGGQLVKTGRRFLLVALPVAAVLAAGAAFPGSTAGGAQRGEAQHAGASPKEEAAAAHAEVMLPARAVGTVARYHLSWDAHLTTPREDTRVVHLEGTWTTVERANGQRDAQLVADELSVVGDDAPQARDLQGAYQLVSVEGTLRGVGFGDDVPERARAVLAEIATLFQCTQREGAQWTASEQDARGTFEAQYRRLGEHALRKTRARYVAATGGVVAIEPSEDSEFRFDERGLVSASVRLDVVYPMGKGGAPVRITHRATLLRESVEEAVLIPSPVAGSVVPLTGSRSEAARKEAREKRLTAVVGGAGAPELVTLARSAAHLSGAEGHAKMHEARRRLSALAELDKGASRKIAEEVRASAKDIATVGVLVGALASAHAPEATRALSSLLGAALPADARAAVLSGLALAKAPTAEELRRAHVGARSAGRRAGGPRTGSRGAHRGGRGPERRRGPARAPLRGGPDADRRAAYLEALANTGSPDMLPTMQAALTGGDARLAQVAAFGLRFVPGEDADALLQGLIRTPGVGTLAAIRAAAYRSADAWTPILQQALTDYAGQEQITSAIQKVLDGWSRNAD